MVELIVVAGAMLQMARSAPQAIVVTAQGSPIESVSCRVVNEADATAVTRLRRTLTSFEWSCTPGDRLQCDAPSLEPIDIDAQSCAMSGVRLSFQKSGFVSLQGDGPSTVEWRAETAKGTRLIATRQLASSAQLPISIGGRIIRIHRGEWSPVSYHVVQGDHIRIDRAKSGGEAFGRIEKKRINPVRVLLDGPTQLEVPIDYDGRFSAFGLIPGDYDAIPIYAGGIRGSGLRAGIVGAATSEVYGLVHESVGGILLGIGPEVCSPTDRVSVTRLQTQARAATFERAIRKSLSEGCEWHLEGLRPGRYEATITNPEHNDLKAAADFTIEADHLAWASIGEPRVVVEGRVRLGQTPGARLLLAFTRADSSQRLWVTETDRNGDYRLALDRAGNYSVEVRASRRMGAEAVLARLQTGVNRFDLNLPETRLTVTLQRADGQPIDEIVSVHLDGLSKTRSGLVLPKDGHVLEFAGIPMGNYMVTADTNSGLVSVQPGAASIAQSTPEARVALTLSTNIGELRLLSSEGGPVQGARVQVNSRILDEREPGVFELKAVSPGTEVLVSAPGLVPVCHLLTATDFHRGVIVMRRGSHAVEINFTPPVSGPIGEISGLPGSTCAVPLGTTSFGATEDANSTTIRIVGMPEGRFSYRPTLVSPPQTMDVPGPPLKFTKPRVQF